MAKLSIAIVVLLACSSVSTGGNGATDSDAVSYVPTCTPPDGFELQSCRLVEITPEEVFSSLWSRQEPKKELDIVKIEKLPKRRRLKKYVNSVEENWRRGTDRIEFDKKSCPDPKTLQKWIDYNLRAYATVPTKIEPPTVGQRAWVLIDKVGPSHLLALLASEDLNLVRVWVSIESADIEEMGSLATSIARQTLNKPFPVQKPLEERIDAYVGKVGKRHGFEKWKGKINMRGREVTRLDIAEDFFSEFSKNTRIDTPEEARGRKIGAKLREASSGAKVEIDIDVADDPTAAQERMLRLMALDGMPADYRKCDPNDPDEQIKAGDVCFKFHPSSTHGTRGNKIYHKVFFCRNNVSVYLRTAHATDPKKDARLPAIASFIDKRLQTLLERKG